MNYYFSGKLDYITDAGQRVYEFLEYEEAKAFMHKFGGSAPFGFAMPFSVYIIIL